MNNTKLLKLSEDTKNVILEVSALSGISQNIIKEVFEYLLINWAIKISDHPDDYADLDIPYIGTVHVKFVDDKVTETGDIKTEIESYVDIDESFKNLIGTIHDEGRTELISMMMKKIEQAIMVASSYTPKSVYKKS